MTLANMNWSAVLIHQVVSAFLRAERHEFGKIFPPWLPLIDHPNLGDPVENQKRLRLLYYKRGMFMIEVPPDTRWYEVRYLNEDHLDQLYCAGRFNAPWAGKKLIDAAEFGDELYSDPKDWKPIILWGHDKAGPLVILEGNHRLLAYVRARPRPLLHIAVYVGLSQGFCFWHPLDPPYMLANDLFDKKAKQIVPSDDWFYCPN